MALGRRAKRIRLDRNLDRNNHARPSWFRSTKRYEPRFHAVLTEGGLLDGIVGFARGAQHPVGDCSQPGPVLLESLCQPVALVHLYL
jgi:hypothetical protein